MNQKLVHKQIKKDKDDMDLFFKLMNKYSVNYKQSICFNFPPWMLQSETSQLNWKNNLKVELIKQVSIKLET